jgi:hypothetical protein
LQRLPALTATGSWAIAIVPFSNGTGTVTVNVWNAIVSGGSLSPDGSAHPLSISRPGQEARFTFTANAGDNFGIDLSGNTLPAGSTWQVLTPGGGAFTGASAIPTAELSQRLATFTVSGTYTLVIVPFNSATGDITVRLWSDVVAALTVSTPYVLNIAFANQFGRLSFNGTAGQNLTLNLSAVTLPSGSTVQVFNPSGGAVTGVNGFGPAGLNLTIPALAATGVYTVIVTPASPGPGSATVTLQ